MNRFIAVRRDQWQNLLCIQEGRTVRNDNTVAENRLRPQIHRANNHGSGQLMWYLSRKELMCYETRI